MTCGEAPLLYDEDGAGGLVSPVQAQATDPAMMAREKGLEPLALTIMEQPAAGAPGDAAASFVSPEKKVADADEALAGLGTSWRKSCPRRLRSGPWCARSSCPAASSCRRR